MVMVMSRPEYPNCIMPVGVIQRVRQEQDYYDQDPERYERQQRHYEEQREQERQQERDAWEQSDD